MRFPIVMLLLWNLLTGLILFGGFEISSIISHVQSIVQINSSGNNIFLYTVIFHFLLMAGMFYLLRPFSRVILLFQVLISLVIYFFGSLKLGYFTS